MTRVIKIGGSLLRDGLAVARLAQRLRPALATGGTWIVVSAVFGVTDELAQLVRTRDATAAEAIARRHRDWGLPPALHHELLNLLPHATEPAILAWGERASAALLQHHLRAEGHRVPIVELRGRSRLPRLPIAIVPGFYLRDAQGRRRLLPRGGSDITALLVASWLGAGHVQLWKDGGGIRRGDIVAERLASDELLQHIGTTIRPLHPAAARIAKRQGITLVFEDPWGRSPSTVIAPAAA